MTKKKKRGYTQVYTGNGKGKTTAAIGLAVRAAGAGFKVFIAQFIKMGDYSEIKALKRFSDLITVEQFGLGRFTNGKPTPEDIKAAQKGIERVKSVLATNEYNIVIMEEANVGGPIPKHADGYAVRALILIPQCQSGGDR